MKNILIGTMSKANENTPAYIRQLGKLGFECTEVTFGHDCKWLMSGIDTDAFAADCKKALDEYGMEMSALGVYGNPLESDEDAVLCRKSWEFLIDNCDKFGTKLICGFTGRLRDKPVPESIPQYKAVFGDLSARAKEQGVRIAFENCPMGGNWKNCTWNIAFNPRAWELMFEALPADNIGLEWSGSLARSLKNKSVAFGKARNTSEKTCAPRRRASAAASSNGGSSGPTKNWNALP